MNRRLGHLTIEAFLADYWQQAPCLLRGALPDLDFPLDANDLAGLACEPMAEARIISGPNAAGDWSLAHGPFSEQDFDRLGDRNWTLLVQDVEKHYPPAGALLRHFDFLPNWRIDDLMVSFAATGGSVGPHVDQYDVFLCQVAGVRRWEIARHFDSHRRDDVPVDMLASFDSEQSWDVEPGDVLYLPPGVAHHGVALAPCLTASVGFRAPSAADLHLALGEWLAQRDDDGGRYRDPSLGPERRRGEIDGPARARLAALLGRLARGGDEFDAFAGAFLSRFRQAHEPVAPPGAPSGQDQVERFLRGSNAVPHPWARFAWIEREPGQVTLFASGRDFVCSTELAEWVCAGAGTFADGQLPGTDRDCLEALFESGQLMLDD